ncbi:MAG: DUF3142 domain-containing protein [Blastocatellia bacterium]|nr:DUF3142 domain-containing protein [Blastocatellia bacterium]
MSRPAHPSPTPLERPDFVPQRIDRASRGRGVTMLLLLTVVVCAGWSLVLSDRQVRAASDTPVAFWSWRRELPEQSVVDRAVTATGAQTLFVRAGTLHSGHTGLTRIRETTGPCPIGIDVHFVYNATSELLEEFETTGVADLAGAIVDAYELDAARSIEAGSAVCGMQLDLDVPTRLLSRYGELLRAVDARLPEGSQLSVTGLPTWMTSKDLPAMLEPVDFWIPQFYGGSVPRRACATPSHHDRRPGARAGVRRARRLGKPFLAGLAAYGYTLQYNADGSLRAIHGTVDPARVAASPDLESFGETVPAGVAANRRLTYRVHAESVLGGVMIVPGDWIVVETPSSEPASRVPGPHGRKAATRLPASASSGCPKAAIGPSSTCSAIAAALADRDPIPGSPQVSGSVTT